MIDYLRPEQCLDLIIKWVRKRIAALEGVNMVDYRVAVGELKTVLDLLVRARSYIVNVSSKLPPA